MSKVDVKSSKNSETMGKVSGIIDGIIEDAGKAKCHEWQVRWSNASDEDQEMAYKAAEKFENTRDTRLQWENKDAREAWDRFIFDRYASYTNYINRRGKNADRRPFPASRAEATSEYDWEAAVQAMIFFAAFPNINPKEPVQGAKMAPA